MDTLHPASPLVLERIQWDTGSDLWARCLTYKLAGSKNIYAACNVIWSAEAMPVHQTYVYPALPMDIYLAFHVLVWSMWSLSSQSSEVRVLWLCHVLHDDHSALSCYMYYFSHVISRNMHNQHCQIIILFARSVQVDTMTIYHGHAVFPHIVRYDTHHYYTAFFLHPILLPVAGDRCNMDWHGSIM